MGWILFLPSECCHVAWEESLCRLFLLVNLSVCLFLYPMPQGCLNIQVKKWTTHFLISTTPSHIVFSVSQGFDVLCKGLREWEKNIFIYFHQFVQKRRITLHGLWGTWAHTISMILVCLKYSQTLSRLSHNPSCVSVFGLIVHYCGCAL